MIKIYENKLKNKDNDLNNIRDEYYNKDVLYHQREVDYNNITNEYNQMIINRDTIEIQLKTQIETMSNELINYNNSKKMINKLENDLSNSIRNSQQIEETLQMEMKSLKNYYNIEKNNYDDKIILLNEKFELLTDHETANISLKSKLSDKENELHLLKLELNKMSDIKYEFEQLIKEKDNTYNEMKEQLYAKGITIRQLESDISYIIKFY